MANRILIFTGEGKGKTTAAVGTALRAVGQGQNVLFVQFIKDDPNTGEYIFGRKMHNFTIIQIGKGWVTPDTIEKHKYTCKEEFKAVRDAVRAAKGESAFNLLVLDEVCLAAHMGIIDEDWVIEVVNEVVNDIQCNVIMTGRNASEKLMAIADTVTNMQCVKHAYNSGIQAQKGVEF